jgi:hypothetical protein
VLEMDRMTKKGDEAFTPATGKFVSGGDDKAVVGWVKMSAPIDRSAGIVATRAVVISDSDRELLKAIRETIEAEHTDYDAHLALLDRLIGKR